MIALQYFLVPPIMSIAILFVLAGFEFSCFSKSNAIWTDNLGVAPVHLFENHRLIVRLRALGRGKVDQLVVCCR